jgi:deoxycytidine triphosphate deaminase
MALKKSKEWKGTTAEYWKIISSISDFVSGNTRVILGLYVSKEARDNNANNFVEREVIQVNGIDLNRQQEYALITESKKELISPEEKDENGNVTKEAVYSPEMNWFADAEDC